MSVSGRAGLFTMDDGRFFNDLRGTPYTASKRQKSGALRLEFGKVSLTTNTSATITTTVNTGIATVVSPSRIPNPIGTSGGSWIVATTGNFTSASFNIYVLANGQFSGQVSGIDINYFCIGY